MMKNKPNNQSLLQPVLPENNVFSHLMWLFLYQNVHYINGVKRDTELG